MQKFKKRIVYHQSNRVDFGTNSTPKVPPKWFYAYRKLLSLIVQETDKQKLQSKAVQLSHQNQWIK